MKNNFLQYLPLILKTTQLIEYFFFNSEIQKGNLKRAIELYDKAIPLANTELEMAHLFGLKEAAVAQTTVSQKFGVPLPHMMGM